MTANRYFVMRHGESIANRKRIIVSHKSNALYDYGLTALGAEQVMQSATHTRLKQGTLIFSSDFLRAKETAEIIHGIICAESNLILDKRLRERNFGDLELEHTNEYENVWRKDELSANQQEKHIESVTSVLDRSLELVNEIEQSVSGKDVLLVGHGDVLQILITFYQGFEPKFHRSIAHIKNAEIRVLSGLQSLRSA